MKYCPYCGASLVDDVVSFCSECGKELPHSNSKEVNEEKEPKAQKSITAQKLTKKRNVLRKKIPKHYQMKQKRTILLTMGIMMTSYQVTLENTVKASIG